MSSVLTCMLGVGENLNINIESWLLPLTCNLTVPCIWQLECEIELFRCDAAPIVSTVLALTFTAHVNEQGE